MLNTVAKNKALFTMREVKAVDNARALYRKLGHPSEKEYQHILESNFILNCPITVDDAKRALKIYGAAVSTLKGKTVKKQNKGIPDYRKTMIPAPIIEQYKNIRIFMDIFFVNGIPFFHTISNWIIFRTVAVIKN